MVLSLYFILSPISVVISLISRGCSSREIIVTFFLILSPWYPERLTPMLGLTLINCLTVQLKEILVLGCWGSFEYTLALLENLPLLLVVVSLRVILPS